MITVGSIKQTPKARLITRSKKENTKSYKTHKNISSSITVVKRIGFQNAHQNSTQKNGNSTILHSKEWEFQIVALKRMSIQEIHTQKNENPKNSTQKNEYFFFVVFVRVCVCPGSQGLRPTFLYIHTKYETQYCKWHSTADWFPNDWLQCWLTTLLTDCPTCEFPATALGLTIFRLLCDWLLCD